MKAQQQQIIRWWHTTRDYSTGLNLLAQTCRNQVLIRSLSQKSERFGRAKLEYELTKAVGLKYTNMPEYVPSEDETQDNPEDTNGNSQGPFQKIANVVSRKSIEGYPPVVRKLKHEYSENYNKRSIAHKKMGEVAPASTAENNAARAELLLEVKAISDYLEFLHGFINKYHTENIIPNPDEIWPPKKKVEAIVLSVETLQKQRVNLMNANYKDNNRLLFQTTKKLKTENPLPDSPTRKKIELRMTKRSKAILDIENLILDRE